MSNAASGAVSPRPNSAKKSAAGSYAYSYSESLAPEIVSEPAESSADEIDVKKDNIDIICDNLIDGGEAVDIDATLVTDVIDRLRTRQQDIMDGPEDGTFDYDALHRIDEVLEQLVKSGEQIIYDDAHTKEIVAIEQRISKSQKELSEKEKQLKTVRREFKQRRKKDLERLLEQQKKEMEELEAKYSSEELPPKYRKLSGEVLYMRRQEKMLRMTHNFLDAKKLRSDADALEAYEMEQNRIKWQIDGNAAKQALVKKHEHQVKCLNEKWDRQWQVLEPSSIKEQEHCKKVIDTQEKRLREVKGSANDFKIQTTRSVQKAKKERLPQLTSRPPSHMASQRSVNSRMSRRAPTTPQRPRTSFQ